MRSPYGEPALKQGAEPDVDLAIVGAAGDLFARAELPQTGFVAIHGHVVGEVAEQQPERRVVTVERVEQRPGGEVGVTRLGAVVLLLLGRATLGERRDPLCR
ncbi:MAG: hypothetical protein WBQ18_15135 [Solirubrobacteraceae bacterium]